MTKKKTMKFMSIVMLISAMLFVMIGCSKNTNEPKNETQGDKVNTSNTGNKDTSKAPKSIKVAYAGAGNSQPIKDWLSAAKKQFEEANQGASVEFVPINATGNDYYTKLTLMMRSEQTSPDVVFEDSFMFGPDVEAGYLQPVPGIEEWEDWKNFYPAMQDIVKVDGKIYGVMNNTDVQAIYYNKGLFKKAGLPENWQPKNWQEIIDAGVAIKKLDNGIVPIWLYTGKALGEAATFRGFQVFLLGTDDNMYDFNEKKWVTDGPGFSKAWGFLEQISKQGLLEPQKYWSTANASSIVNLELMPQNKVGIVFDGSWIGGNFMKTGQHPWPEGFDAYGVAKIPTADGQAPGFTNQSGGWALALSAKSKNPNLAAEFIKTASNKENLALYNNLNGSIPPRTDVNALPLMQESLAANGFMKQAADFVANTHYRPSVGEYPQISEVIARLTGEIAMGNLTGEQAAEQYAQEVTKIAGKDKVKSNK